jgi:glycosyltransferase involved in cell wall biosynthesis
VEAAGTGAPLTAAVIIPVFDGEAHLAMCLAAIARSNRKPEQVIVVDDASADASLAIARAAGVDVLASPMNLGPAAARNAGARMASADVLLFFDADVCVHPDTIGRLMARLEADHSLDAVIGSYDDEPVHPAFCSQYKNLLHHFTHQRGKSSATTFWTGCGAIRRVVFFECGGFDESYRRPSIEDVELGYRLHAAGRRIALDASVLVQHRKEWGFRELVCTDVFDRAVPWARLIRRYRRAPNDLNISSTQRVSFALLVASISGLFLGLKGAPVAVLGALAILALNRAWFAFLMRKRGYAFAAMGVPVYFLCLLYSGITFGIIMMMPSSNEPRRSAHVLTEPRHTHTENQPH